MKVSEAASAANRVALLEAARRLMLERGVDGAGVIEISRAAGLTQGALYNQFGCKAALAEQAIRMAFAEGATDLAPLRAGTPGALEAFIDAYLSPDHVRSRAEGCPLSACLSDIPRQEPAIQAAFADGVRALLEAIEAALGEPDGRPRALRLLATFVGALTLARALHTTDPELAEAMRQAAAAAAPVAASR